MSCAIEINASAAALIEQEARRSRDGKETGGILLGYQESELGTTLVTQAGDPGPGALRTPTSFNRDLVRARELAEEAYERDASEWIGEWHTHPQGDPRPSRVDLTTYRRHLADTDLGFAAFASLIVIPHPVHGWDHPRISGWLIHRDSARAAELRLPRANISRH